MDQAKPPPTISTSASTSCPGSGSLISIQRFLIAYPDREGHRAANQKSGLLLAWGQAEVWYYTGTPLGPSRCDKTLLSKAAANESRANFISICGPELLGVCLAHHDRELFVISNHGWR
ncbi:unnamed protein product [Tuber melanosporum]|uniref:(Perigord truffle) hypothetical protein n=1 Tax=Tuber melanosporum (strain Mel28) TaxID=656061 RepID=D5GCR8_TUBMM|nr:uncharacterized protein GSTUM_00005991001 [Tuber melanosporum]CAZ82311.1 unnamed protein product [Tuber melanosporum]